MTRDELLQRAKDLCSSPRSIGTDDLEVDNNAKVSVGELGYWVEAWLFIYPPEGEEPDFKLERTA